MVIFASHYFNVSKGPGHRSLAECVDAGEEGGERHRGLRRLRMDGVQIQSSVSSTE